MAHIEYINGYYDGEVNDKGVPHGHGKKHYKTGVVFEGEYVDGVAKGYGVTYFPDGRRLEAYRVNDKIEGHAKWYQDNKVIGKGDYTNGRQSGNWIYNGIVQSEGHYMDGRKNGFWTFVCEAYHKEVEYKYDVLGGPMLIKYTDGTRSTGGYTKNAKSGIWTDTFTDGTRIERKYKKGRETGDWIIYHPDGSETKLVYRRGNVKKEVMIITPEGKEVPFISQQYTPCYMKRPNDDTTTEKAGRTNRVVCDGGYYEGEVNEKNDPHGYGVRYHKTGTIFDGHFVDGKEDGLTNVYFTNGLRMEVMRTAGKKNGRAKLYFGNWMYSEGEFKDNVKIGRWVNYKDTYEEGEYVNGERNGLFIIENEDSCSKSEFVDGMRNGVNVTTYKNGLRSVGLYHNGLQTGRWVNYYPDGTYEEGRYKHGMKEGLWTIYHPNGEVSSVKFRVGSGGKAHTITDKCKDSPTGFDGAYTEEEAETARTPDEKTAANKGSEKKGGLVSRLFGKK